MAIKHIKDLFYGDEDQHKRDVLAKTQDCKGCGQYTSYWATDKICKVCVNNWEPLPKWMRDDTQIMMFYKPLYSSTEHKNIKRSIDLNEK